MPKAHQKSLASAFQTHINRRSRAVPFLGAVGSVPDQPGQNTVRGAIDEDRWEQNLPCILNGPEKAPAQVD